MPIIIEAFQPRKVCIPQRSTRIPPSLPWPHACLLPPLPHPPVHPCLSHMPVCKLQALVYDILPWRKVPESDDRSVAGLQKLQALVSDARNVAGLLPPPPSPPPHPLRPCLAHTADDVGALPAGRTTDWQSPLMGPLTASSQDPSQRRVPVICDLMRHCVILLTC